ncbi:MAG: conjugal transfer protein TraD [Proteobacteria bacterium]|nr:conjugal transfer protein TraD [Pseudomonadota bacterium]
MRKPVDLDAQIKALQEKAKSLKDRQRTQLGELVLATGADTLPLEAIAGVLLAAVEQAREKPEAVARWTERGAAFFRGDRKQGTRGKRNGAGDPAPGPSGDGAPAPAGNSPAP